MGDTSITIIAIFLAAILMFIFPLVAMSDRSDDISQLSVQTQTTEFVDDVTISGKLTAAKYEKFVESISATGNTYDVELKIQTLDENPGKKTSQVENTKIGENVYYTTYTSQIMSELEKNNGNGTILLKEGDIFSASVKNTNTTMSQQLKSFLYKVTGNDQYSISAEHSGIVKTTGNSYNN